MCDNYETVSVKSEIKNINIAALPILYKIIQILRHDKNEKSLEIHVRSHNPEELIVTFHDKNLPLNYSSVQPISVLTCCTNFWKIYLFIFRINITC